MVRKLTDEQMRQGFQNVGVDLTCGACMCAFFHGSNGYPHTCEQRKGEQPVVVAVVAVAADDIEAKS